MEHLKTLRIAVLQAGRAVEEAIERHGDYDDMCKALVFRAPEEADTFCVLDGEFPDSIDAYDVFVVTDRNSASTTNFLGSRRWRRSFAILSTATKSSLACASATRSSPLRLAAK